MFGAMPTREKLNRMRADQRRKMLLLGAGGTTCAVCGHPKAGGRPLCEECLGTLPRADWDLLISDSDGFRQIVEAMRLKRQALAVETGPVESPVP